MWALTAIERRLASKTFGSGLFQTVGGVLLVVGILDLHETQRVLAEGELARGKVTTMSYDVSDAGELADLKPGDLITAILVVVRDDIHLDDIKKVAAMPPPLFR